MTELTGPAFRPGTAAVPELLSRGRVVAMLSVTVFLALIAFYFVGFDEGPISVLGRTMMVHEFMHDARHLLGFPCH
jgi:hypothetical protein